MDNLLLFGGQQGEITFSELSHCFLKIQTSIISILFFYFNHPTVWIIGFGSLLEIVADACTERLQAQPTYFKKEHICNRNSLYAIAAAKFRVILKILQTALYNIFAAVLGNSKHVLEAMCAHTVAQYCTCTTRHVTTGNVADWTVAFAQYCCSLLIAYDYAVLSLQ